MKLNFRSGRNSNLNSCYSNSLLSSSELNKISHILCVSHKPNNASAFGAPNFGEPQTVMNIQRLALATGAIKDLF